MLKENEKKQVASISFDADTAILSVVVMDDVEKKDHVFGEELHECADGSYRRPEAYDNDASDCWGFLDGKRFESSDDFEIEIFNAVLDAAFEILSKNSILDADDCIPDGSDGLLWESDWVYDDEQQCFVDFQAAVNLMDDDIREDLHSKGFYSKQDFFSAYKKAHEEKYHEEFVVM